MDDLDAVETTEFVEASGDEQGGIGDGGESRATAAMR
jgi:hypothetical protein